MPEFQAKIVTSRGTYYPDCYWREARLIGECDGAIKYSTRDAVVAEKVREQVLRDEGNRFVRWLGGEIMSRPGEVMTRIARALEL
jgi:very-short-patch-repair endonuclease